MKKLNIEKSKEEKNKYEKANDRIEGGKKVFGGATALAFLGLIGKKAFDIAKTVIFKA